MHPTAVEDKQESKKQEEPQTKEQHVLHIPQVPDEREPSVVNRSSNKILCLVLIGIFLLVAIVLCITLPLTLKDGSSKDAGKDAQISFHAIDDER